MTPDNSLTRVDQPGLPALAQQLSTLELIQGCIQAGITKENVEVVKELVAMRRQEINQANKVLFNQQFFQLRKEIQTMSLYADKSAKTDGGGVAYTYCSEQEISGMLETALLRHGFAMMFGQRQDGERTVAIITLIHEGGHEETREYAVRSGGTNRMKDATAADTGATTSAWRHLCVKWFGLKSRIHDSDDVRNLGDLNTKVTQAQAEELERRAGLLNCQKAFLDYAKAPKFSDIPANRYADLDQMLSRKEKQRH